MDVKDFYYDLPQELIAQDPLEDRSSSRLLVLDKKTGEIRISSVFRDTYMQVSAEGKYHKINQAYFDGGHKQAVDSLERNLDLQIDEKFATDDITIPFHSGAESYYKEKGINLNTQ